MSLGVIHDESPVVGKRVSDFYRMLAGEDFEIIVIMRREHVLLPHGDTVLEKGDRLVLIAASRAREPLTHYVAPVPEEEKGGVQVAAAAGAS